MSHNYLYGLSKIAPFLISRMTTELVPSQTRRPINIILPPAISRAGERTSNRFIEFFTANIRNRNTRAAYARAVSAFFAWLDDKKIPLEAVTPIVVAAYVEQHPGADPSRKLALAAVRMLFDYLVTGGVLPMNPAASVKGPRYSLKRGKTPVLDQEQARALFDSIDTSTIIGLRDRALLGVMVYSFARIGAVVGMNVDDYRPNGKRWMFRLHEKGGKYHEVPAHHKAEEYLDAYLDASLIEADRKAPLFQTVKHKKLTGNRLDRRDALRMVKRRACAAGLPRDICNHTFRATGITVYLQNGGTLEKAQQIANHESPRTTKLYDRTSDAITLDEVERIVL
jgi:site-specific recombinase XerD